MLILLPTGGLGGDKRGFSRVWNEQRVQVHEFRKCYFSQVFESVCFWRVSYGCREVAIWRQQSTSHSTRATEKVAIRHKPALYRNRK